MRGRDQEPPRPGGRGLSLNQWLVVAAAILVGVCGLVVVVAGEVWGVTLVGLAGAVTSMVTMAAHHDRDE